MVDISGICDSPVFILNTRHIFRSFLLLGVIKALQCPFLTRIPINQVRQHATELLQLADKCPVMGHVVKYSAMAVQDQQPHGKI